MSEELIEKFVSLVMKSVGKPSFYRRYSYVKRLYVKYFPELCSEEELKEK